MTRPEVTAVTVAAGLRDLADLFDQGKIPVKDWKYTYQGLHIDKFLETSTAVREMAELLGVKIEISVPDEFSKTLHTTATLDIAGFGKVTFVCIENIVPGDGEASR